MGTLTSRILPQKSVSPPCCVRPTAPSHMTISLRLIALLTAAKGAASLTGYDRWLAERSTWQVGSAACCALRVASSVE